MDRTPYTYLIGWSKLNLWYYGVKYAKGCHPSQLWKSYFTSSKHVKNTVEAYGDPDVIQIRKIFANIDESRHWENRVLKRMNVIHDDKWLNKTDNKSISVDLCSHNKNIGSKRSDETKAKMRESQLKRNPTSDHTKKRMSEAKKGTVACFDKETSQVIRIQKETFDSLREIRYFGLRSKEASHTISSISKARSIADC